MPPDPYRPQDRNMTAGGAVDPGLVLWLLESVGLSSSEVARGLEREAGLAGGSGDMRDVVAGVDRDDPA